MPQPQQSSHDEPFVIDNKPLGIDVGPKHEPLLRQEGTVWIRPHSDDLGHIVALRKEPGGVEGVVDIEASTLSKGPITIEVRGAPERTLTLTWNADDLRIAPAGFELTKKGRRLKQPKDLKIAAVTWVDARGKTHRFEGTPKHEAIFVALVE
jgi:hypothetical protein